MRALISTAAIGMLIACGHTQPQDVGQAGNLAPGGGSREQSRPREEASAPPGAPVETGPRSVPEFEPAFPGQTRVPAVKTRTAFQVTEIASGFDRPWAIAFLPDRRMLVTEKPGQLRIVTAEGRRSQPVSGLPPVDARRQGGLLDVELAQDFSRSNQIYWTYYEPRRGGNGLAVARGRLIDGPQPRVENIQVVFRMLPTLESTLHAGGRMVWARDGTLFVTLGERSILPGRVQAQRLDSHFGKIVRINADGSVPRDNPFVGRQGAQPGRRDGAANLLLGPGDLAIGNGDLFGKVVPGVAWKHLHRRSLQQGAGPSRDEWRPSRERGATAYGSQRSDPRSRRGPGRRALSAHRC